MTDTRVGSEVVQAVVRVDGPTGVADRFGSEQVQAVMKVDPSTIFTRFGVYTSQVVVQTKRGYVMDFDGKPIMVFSDGSLHHVRVADLSNTVVDPPPAEHPYVVAVKDSASNTPAILDALYPLTQASYAAVAGDVVETSGNNRPADTGLPAPAGTPNAGKTPLLSGSADTSSAFYDIAGTGTAARFIVTHAAYGGMMSTMKGQSAVVRWGTGALGGYRAISHKDDGGSQRGWQFKTTPTDKLQFLWWEAGGAGPIFLDSTTTLLPNVTYHVGWGIDPADSKMKLYINGVVEASSASATTLKHVVLDMPVGFGLNGLMEYFAIWKNFGPTPARMLAHYNAMAGL